MTTNVPAATNDYEAGSAIPLSADAPLVIERLEETEQAVTTKDAEPFADAGARFAKELHAYYGVEPTGAQVVRAIKSAGPSTRWLALYTAKPGNAANVGEATYDGYCRVSMGCVGWDADWSNLDSVMFPANLGTVANAITHVAIVTTAAGPGHVLVRVALSSAYHVSHSVQPVFPPGHLSLMGLSSVGRDVEAVETHACERYAINIDHTPRRNPLAELGVGLAATPAAPRWWLGESAPQRTRMGKKRGTR